MNDKETLKRMSLLEREVSVLAEDLDKSRLDARSELDALRLEIETLKTLLTEQDSRFQGRFEKIKSQTVLEKNPEWMSGQP